MNHGEELNLSLYWAEVGNLSRQLGKTWKELMYANASEQTVYRKWGGETRFLEILGMYMIIEKGLDINHDDAALTEAIDELTSRTF
ncbi:MAG TPA: hypothetical protein VFW90_02850 [Candidatus Saccharimonadales bacterium]|nr:hypothetical protein [Candidatus Saccharimonadales bacterium]